MANDEKELRVPYKYARMWPREVFYRQLQEPKPVAQLDCYECNKFGEMIRCREGHNVHRKCMKRHEPWCEKNLEKGVRIGCIRQLSFSRDLAFTSYIGTTCRTM